MAPTVAVLGIRSVLCKGCGTADCNTDRIMAEPGELYCDRCWSRWESCGWWQPSIRVSTRPPLPGPDRGLPVVRPEDAYFLPSFMCNFEDLSLMEKLRGELPTGRDFTEWHGSRHMGIQFEGEGARHDGPDAPPAFQAAVARLEAAFGIRASASRINLYRSSRDYKPLHFDRGRDNNGTPQMTVGASFGATRDLTFVHARTGVTATFPQNNGDVFAFTPELNKVFSHGVPRLSMGASTEPDDETPRLSLIIWGARISDLEKAEHRLERSR